VQFQLIFKLQQILKELSQFHVSYIAYSDIRLIVHIYDLVAIFVTFEFSLDIRLEFLIFRAHHVLEVLISHLFYSSGCRYWELSNQRQLDLLVRELNVEKLTQIGLQINHGQI